MAERCNLSSSHTMPTIVLSVSAYSHGFVRAGQHFLFALFHSQQGVWGLPHVCPWPLIFRAPTLGTRKLQSPPNFTALPTGSAAPQTETADCCAPLFSCRPWNRSAAQFTGRPFSFDICKPALRPCRPRPKPTAQPKGRYCGYLRFAERQRLPGL